MSGKRDRFFFDTLDESAALALRAAKHLCASLTDFHREILPDRLRTMHEIERDADVCVHKLSDALARAFVTPLEREDLAEIGAAVDEITDRLEEVLQRVAVSRLASLPEDVLRFCDRLVLAATTVRDAIALLPSFRKPSALREKIIAVGKIEEECDDLYLSLCAAATAVDAPPLDVVFLLSVYDHLESAADACEDVADVLSRILIKNT